jgi:hypothetical protein
MNRDGFALALCSHLFDWQVQGSKFKVQGEAAVIAASMRTYQLFKKVQGSRFKVQGEATVNAASTRSLGTVEGCKIKVQVASVRQ